MALISSALLAKETTGIINLLSNPGKFVGREIQVLGYVHEDSNVLGLYLTKEYARYHEGVFGKVKIDTNKQVDFSMIPNECKAGYLTVTGVIELRNGIPYMKLTEDPLYIAPNGEKYFQCEIYEVVGKSKKLKLDFYGKPIKD